MKEYPGMDDAATILEFADGLLSAKPEPNASQKQAPPQPMLDAYGKTRERRSRDLANKRLIPLHVASLQVFMNLNDNGDALINERYEVVSSEGGPIDFLPTALPEDYSFVPDGLKYNDKPAGQIIEWRFDARVRVPAAREWSSSRQSEAYRSVTRATGRPSTPCTSTSATGEIAACLVGRKICPFRFAIAMTSSRFGWFSRNGSIRRAFVSSASRS
jgi:hypothetical protein